MKLVYKDIPLPISPVKKELIIKDKSVQSLKFNVLNNKSVQETLTFKKYVVRGNKIETYFDREYNTDMLRSPNHFIFLSALVNLQKMIYVLMCSHFKLQYNPNDNEKLKIWPIDVEVKMNGLIRKNKNLMQDFEIDSIEKISPTKYHISGRSSSESTIFIKGSALIYLI